MPSLPTEFLRTPISHRGLHDARRGRTENSASAFEAAIRECYAIEADVQLSADGCPVVYHDPSLARLTDRRDSVRSLNAKALSTVALKGGPDRIALLPETLDLVAGRVPLLIEIKAQADSAGNSELVLATLRALKNYRDPVALMSFDPSIVSEIGDNRPDFPHGLITEWIATPGRDRARGFGSTAILPDIMSCGAEFISHQFDDLDRADIRKLRATGFPVLCWTVRSPQEEERARRHCDNITFEGFRPQRPDLDPSTPKPT